jgi:hypothetical protein
MTRGNDAQSTATPQRQVRASYTDHTIRVYQAFADAIALLPIERVYQPRVDDLTHLGL